MYLKNKTSKNKANFRVMTTFIIKVGNDVRRFIMLRFVFPASSNPFVDFCSKFFPDVSPLYVLTVPIIG